MASSATPRKVGRPRLLTLEQVVDAVRTVGLETFSMKAVADELGVTIATLYKYVDDRDHLFRLAVDASLAATRVPEDTGQAWQHYVVEFASAVTSRMVADRQIMDQLIHSGVGADTEDRLAQVFTKALAARGFSDVQARCILDQVGVVCFGVAVRVHCDVARGTAASTPAIADPQAYAEALLRRVLQPVLAVGNEA